MHIKIDTDTVFCFDLDDTLYNELDFLKSAYKEIAQNLSPNNWTEAYATMLAKFLIGQDTFQYLATRYDTPKLELISLYRNHVPNIAPFDGVLSFFEEIRNKKAKIAIITDGRSNTQRSKIKALELSTYIDFMVISEEVKSKKPNKKNFELIVNRFPANKYFYFGDNYSKDFITPNRLGWTTVALINNGKNIHVYDPSQFEKDYIPKYSISSFLEMYW